MNVFKSFIGPANVYVQYSSQQEQNNACATVSTGATPALQPTTQQQTLGVTPTQPTSFQWSAPPPSYNNVMETSTTKWHYSKSLTFLWWLHIHMHEIRLATCFLFTCLKWKTICYIYKYICLKSWTIYRLIFYCFNFMHINVSESFWSYNLYSKYLSPMVIAVLSFIAQVIEFNIQI